jgi:hypothetical protein
MTNRKTDWRVIHRDIEAPAFLDRGSLLPLSFASPLAV